MSDRELLLETFVMCLVQRLGAEVRISKAELETPPHLLEQHHPASGDYTLWTFPQED